MRRLQRETLRLRPHHTFGPVLGPSRARGRGPNAGWQRGAALAMSLVFLLILTLIAVTAVTTGSLGEKMAANLKDQRTAFQAAESALRAGEGWLRTTNYADPTKIIDELSTLPCTDATHVCQQNFLGNLADAADYPNSWWLTNGVAYGTSAREIKQAKDDPRYLAEFRYFEEDDLGKRGYPGSPGRAYYRVYGFGLGATDSATAIVESHYGVHINPKQ
jgi:type IV pilus assembly protein PilX